MKEATNAYTNVRMCVRDREKTREKSESTERDTHTSFITYGGSSLQTKRYSYIRIDTVKYM